MLAQRQYKRWHLQAHPEITDVCTSCPCVHVRYRNYSAKGLPTQRYTCVDPQYLSEARCRCCLIFDNAFRAEAVFPQRLLFIADWGLSENSSTTLDHILQSAQNSTNPPLVHYVGDFCYAGAESPLNFMGPARFVSFS